MSTKERMSTSVDAALLAAARAGVARGEADSLSAWVSDALRLKIEHEERLHAADEFIAAWEAEHGEITQEDIEAAERWAAEHTIEVQPDRGAA